MKNDTQTRILNLFKILICETDERHPMPMRDILTSIRVHRAETPWCAGQNRGISVL